MTLDLERPVLEEWRETLQEDLGILIVHASDRTRTGQALGGVVAALDYLDRRLERLSKPEPPAPAVDANALAADVWNRMCQRGHTTAIADDAADAVRELLS